MIIELDYSESAMLRVALSERMQELRRSLAEEQDENEQIIGKEILDRAQKLYAKLAQAAQA